MCTGNIIKTSAGNTTCDEKCGGVETVPNDEHTACGKFKFPPVDFDVAISLFQFLLT